MTVRASGYASTPDMAASLTLRAPGLAYTEDHHEVGTQVPRLGQAYWQTQTDFDWAITIDYTTTGANPHALEIWASSTSNSAPPAVCVTRLPLPPSASSSFRALVSAQSLAAIGGAALYLSAKLIVGAGGTVECGVVLEHAS